MSLASLQLKRLRRTLPSIAEGFLQIDLFTEAHFDEKGVWVVLLNEVYRSYRSAKGWGRWRRQKDLSRQDFSEWRLKKMA